MNHWSSIKTFSSVNFALFYNFSVLYFFLCWHYNSPSMADPMAAVLSDMVVRVWGTGDYWRHEHRARVYRRGCTGACPASLCSVLALTSSPPPHSRDTREGARVNKLGSQMCEILMMMLVILTLDVSLFVYRWFCLSSKVSSKWAVAINFPLWNELINI